MTPSESPVDFVFLSYKNTKNVKKYKSTMEIINLQCSAAAQHHHTVMLCESAFALMSVAHLCAVLST